MWELMTWDIPWEELNAFQVCILQYRHAALQQVIARYVRHDQVHSIKI